MLYLAIKRANGTFRPMLAVNVSKLAWRVGLPLVVSAFSRSR